MSIPLPEPDPQRKAAVQRLQAKQNFWRFLASSIFVWIVLIGVWLLSGRGYFWPGWAIFGMGIGLLWSGYAAFGPHQGPPSEDKVQAEIRKMQ